MAHRRVHYEVAFEDYLRCREWPYVAVDEARKAAFGPAGLKNFDFLVYSASGANLLVDVKGRKFPDTSIPGKRGRGPRAWENWIPLEDIEGLARWEQVFGADFAAVLVFAYWLQGPPGRSPFADVHFCRRRHYAFLGVTLADYSAAARRRSARWETLTMPVRAFRAAARDFAEFL